MLTRRHFNEKVGIVKKSTTRRSWSRIHIPEDLRLLLESVGRGDGYPPERLHFFIYALLKECRSDPLEKAASVLRIRLDDYDEGLIAPED
jgi:hypothetical protein